MVADAGTATYGNEIADPDAAGAQVQHAEHRLHRCRLTRPLLPREQQHGMGDARVEGSHEPGEHLWPGALRDIEQALELAKNGYYQRIFLDEGEIMQQILVGTAQRSSMDPDSQLKQYIGQLLNAFEAEPFSSSKEFDQLASLLNPLSERELEVIRLLEEGLSNQEIAARLHISLNTVKAHLKSIYGKLGVNNRVQAIAKGRELGL